MTESSFSDLLFLTDSHESSQEEDDEVVLQCSATLHKEQQKLCLAAEGFGNRLCFLESTSNSKLFLFCLW
ncbi:hypothetical protein QTP70_002801 [Hemibagrus guttatus]|uniref:Inositol 1,4,5-trisphosphate/ryanodine receptor domain-containing protein n=1 Tax=Hemibagrus guttatus TaxID=175788 RepID=A0AAE0QQJ1_9TELE|nr:hypothetical protein QTP70_002801 [Hemibagrus guttatus]